MSENLVACEFEDSTNCVWNAQEQGNGIGESFVDIDGVAYYVDDVNDIEVNELVEVAPEPEIVGDFYVDCDTQMLHYYEGYMDGENWIETFFDEGTPASSGELYNYGCTDVAGNSLWPVAPEIELPDPVEEVIIEVPVIVDPVPEELAYTGTGDVVAGLLLGLALLTAGVVLFIRGRKNK